MSGPRLGGGFEGGGGGGFVFRILPCACTVFAGLALAGVKDGVEVCKARKEFIKRIEAQENFIGLV